VQEVGGDEAVGLGGEELAPSGAGALRGRVDAGSVQDLRKLFGGPGGPDVADEDLALSVALWEWPSGSPGRPDC
jgi:hypothetical protein